MLMSPLALDPASALAPAGDPAAVSAAALPAGGELFADQLALAQSALPAGQDLAASTLPLRTFSLSPELEVITAPAGGPDGDSLAEFARAQGLDDEVVAWLFPQTALAQALAALPGIPGGVTPPGIPADGAARVAASGLPTPAGTLPLPGGLPGAPDLAADAPLLPGAAVTTAGWLQQQQAALATPAASPPPGEIDPAQAAASPLPAALLAAAATTARGARPDLVAPPLRLPPQDRGVPVEILQLDIHESLQSLWDEPAAPRIEAGGAAQTGASPGQGSGPGQGQGQGQTQGQGGTTGNLALPDDAPPASTLSQRAAGYQELSQRLGEALAQRVMAQIERGNWEVRLMLRPARLGEVEIDLALRSGALDASFRASNPVTRDLLNEGLPRLREILADAGMDIAGLNVGSGRSQQTGGNPTPRHARAPQGTVNAETGIMATSAPATQPRLRGPGTGWDVMV